MKIEALVIALLLVLCASCKSPSTRNPLTIEDSGVDVVERIQISVHDEPAPKVVEGSSRELDPERIFEPGVLILDREAGEVLERLRTSSATSISGIWIDEGELLPPPDSQRRVFLRRVLEFPNIAELRRAIADESADEIAQPQVQPDGSCEIVVAGLEFTIVPSENGRACRLVLDSIHARRDTARALRMLQHEGSIDLVVAFTLRSITDVVQSHTVLFYTTLQTEGTEWCCGSQQSNWFPRGPESGPWSIQVIVFDREEIRGLAKDLGGAAQFLFGIAGKARKASVL